MTVARRRMYNPEEYGTYHCFSRCVRRSFLCGQDEYTGIDYSHRKQWLEGLLELAATYFAIDVISFGILDNHFHVMLRNRPDLRDKLPPTAVAERWLYLFPKRRDKEGRACQPTPKEIHEITRDKRRVKVLRKRLGNISWLMAYVKERVARRANREDDVRGAFFEKRFEMRRLLSENAILACSIYVDLNLIRAGVAPTPETSQHTSAYRRIQALQSRRAGRIAKEAMADRWLAPIYLNQLPKDQRFAEKGWRASDTPALEMTIEQYLELLDWSGRQIQEGKRGHIPAHLAPILDRLGIHRDRWLDLVESFGALFHRIAGDPAAVEQQAAREQQQWFQGIQNCRRMFTSPEDG